MNESSLENHNQTDTNNNPPRTNSLFQDTRKFQAELASTHEKSQTSKKLARSLVTSWE